MTNFEFAKAWIEKTWQDDFRLGAVTFDPARFNPEEFQRLSRRKRREHQDREWSECERRAKLVTTLIEKIQDFHMNINEAREMIAEHGMADQIWLADTKEDLIATITAILDRGADAWDNGDQYARVGNGIFAVNFFYDHY